MGRRDLDRDGMGAAPTRIAASSPHGRNGAARPGCSSPTSRCSLFSAISGDQFLTWGWRVPFWLSIVMVGIGLYIRLGILETPIFAAHCSKNAGSNARPVIEVIKRQPKQIILTALARMAEQGPFYVYAAFVFVYGTKVSGASRDFLLTALLVATGLSAVTIPLAGHISDRIGRKRMYLIGAATTGIFAFFYFAMMNTMAPALIFLAIVLSFIPHDMMYGPQAALIAECFTPRLRYSGSSLGFHLSSIIAGGPAPLIATALFAATGSGYAIALYILFCAIVSITATLLARLHQPGHLAGGSIQGAGGEPRSSRGASRQLTFQVSEVAPGADRTTDDEILGWVKKAAETTYHPVGTCKMGSDPMAVVDAQLRIDGIAGLRVADASIMPTLTSGNTNAPSIMIGEKAADMMLNAAI